MHLIILAWNCSNKTQVTWAWNLSRAAQSNCGVLLKRWETNVWTETDTVTLLVGHTRETWVARPNTLNIDNSSQSDGPTRKSNGLHFFMIFQSRFFIKIIFEFFTYFVNIFFWFFLFVKLFILIRLSGLCNAHAYDAVLSSLIICLLRINVIVYFIIYRIIFW